MNLHVVAKQKLTNFLKIVASILAVVKPARHFDRAMLIVTIIHSRI